MASDRFGHSLTTTSDEAARHYVRALDCMTTANFGAAEALDGALEADPDFALAHIAKARWLMMHLRAAEGRAEIAAARALKDRVTSREARHIEIIATALEGQGAKAFGMLEEHLAEFPRDELPLFMALGVFGILGFSGRLDHREAELAMLERIKPHWGDDWFFETFHGWALIESGQDVAGGIAEVERSLSKNSRNGWGAHALAHGYYEAGDAETSASYVSGWLPAYDRRSQLHGHISWHLALCELARGNTDRAHEIYSDAIRVSVTHGPQVISLADPAAFLWRCQIYSTEASDRKDWRDIADFARKNFPQAGMHFADLHAVMADVAVGDLNVAQRRIGEMRERLALGRLAPGEVIPLIGEGLVAFGRGDWAAAADLIGSVLPDLPRVGGSHAQREIFDDTYIVACLRAGRGDAARQRLTERLSHRPSERDQRWLASV